METLTIKQAKKRIIKQFPQLGKNIIVWKPHGIIGNVFKVQQYIVKKETFGNEYYCDLDLNDITN